MVFDSKFRMTINQVIAVDKLACAEVLSGVSKSLRPCRIRNKLAPAQSLDFGPVHCATGVSILSKTFLTERRKNAWRSMW
jgi:hypothetical protein